MNRLRRRIAVIVLLGLASFGPAAPAIGQADVSTRQLETQIYGAFERAEYARAIILMNEYLRRYPGDSGMLYNKACAYSLKGDQDSAAAALLESIQSGFRDFEFMQRDPDLEALRTHPEFKRIFEAIGEPRGDGNVDRAGDPRPGRHEGRRGGDATAQRALTWFKGRFGDSEYDYRTDEKHRLLFATALDPVARGEMLEMIDREADYLVEALFEQPPSYYVFIAVPTPEHADELFDGDASSGGVYDHVNRRLITRNIGGSLRHELCHVMHYGHMSRLGQTHPIWIQEGLASLFEDYELDERGSMTVLPNERHNIVKGRQRAGRLMDWETMFTMSQSDFMRLASQLYPQARSIFEYLADTDKLARWYEIYVDGFGVDPTGKRAFEAAYGKDLDEIERDWRRWVASRPEVDVRIDTGDASMGIRSRANTSNDGVLVSEVVRGGPAHRAGVRVGDVIVAIDGRETRSLTELLTIIGAKDVGDLVSVRLRRGTDYRTMSIRLEALGPVR